MRVTDVRVMTVPIKSEIRNAWIDFRQMTAAVVAVVTDTVRDGRPVIGYGFNSNGRYAPTSLLRERFIPRLLEAPPLGWGLARIFFVSFWGEFGYMSVPLVGAQPWDPWEGALWLVRRTDKGLLGGMAALPSTSWRAQAWTRAEALAHAPVAARWRKAGQIRHVFTHFALTLDVYVARAAPDGEGCWRDAISLPTVFLKAAAVVS